MTDVNGNLQFESNANYGNLLKEMLQETREKELSKKLMQVLAIIAYKQPITKSEIEDLRGVGADYVVSALVNLNLIMPVGRRETIGNPILYGTTDEFLKKFGISTLEELPDYEQMMSDIRNNYEKYYAKRDGLYFDRDIDEEDSAEGGEEVASAVDVPNDESDEGDELPDFLKDEDIIEIE